MPKNKRRAPKGRSGLTASNLKNQSSDENSELNVDDASTISNASTNMSYQDIDSVDDQSGRAKGGEDQIEKIDNIDSQINTCLDGLLEKGFKEREDSLKTLKKILSNKYVFEYLSSKCFTITESTLKCIKKGKSSEQLLACDVLMLTFIQFVSYQSDASKILLDSKQLLIELIDDDKIEPEVRAACVKTLGLGLFITNDINSVDIVSILDKLEALFSQSYAKGDGTFRILTPKMYELHAAALSAWCLLLCIMPLPFVNKLSQKHVKHFQDFLKSQDVDLRIVAGETIAFLYQLAECDSHSDMACFEDEELLELLTNLANDSSKHRSKKDKKQQRVSFRDILRTIEEGAFESQTIKFGGESLILDNWIRRKQYETLKELLGPGMNVHLHENEYIRDLFDLGAPVLSDAARRANLTNMSRMEKVQFNKEQFRNRTKSMNKKRENKEVTSAALEDDV